MKLEQSFSVAAPVEEVWAALVDIERVADCLPGARITDRMDDGSFVGTLSSEGAGPATVHDGVVKLESLDPAAHSVTISVKGADRDGVGSVRASLLATARTAGGLTVVDIAADVILDGHDEDPVAGDDLLGRLLAEFAGRLESDLGAAAPGEGPPTVTALPTPGLPGEHEPAPPIPPPAPSREDQYAEIFGTEPEEPLAVPAPPEHPAPHGDPLTPDHREPPLPAEPYPEPVDPAPPHGDPLAAEPVASAVPPAPEPPAAPPPPPPPAATAPPPPPPPPAAAAPPPPPPAPPVDDTAPTQRASIPPPGYERDAPASPAKPKTERSPGSGLGARLKALFSRKR
jgi:carbon monoxide dehydrogenase subunit G